MLSLRILAEYPGSANIIRVHIRAMLIHSWVVSYSNKLTRRFHQLTKALMEEYHEMFTME
jgi:hypothetical protein